MPRESQAAYEELQAMDQVRSSLLAVYTFDIPLPILMNYSGGTAVDPSLCTAVQDQYQCMESGRCGYYCGNMYIHPVASTATRISQNEIRLVNTSTPPLPTRHH